jgi:hypothetical protein
MTRLSTFTIHAESPPSIALIKVLTRSPSLRHIVFQYTPLLLPKWLSLRFHHLDSITLPTGDASFDEWPSARSLSPAQLQQHINIVSRMIIDNQATLRRVDVSAQLVLFRDISVASWPRLESLILTEYTPPATRYPDTTSIPALVQGMPKLKELHLLPRGRTCLDDSYLHRVTQRRPSEPSPEAVNKIKSPLRNITIFRI